MWDYGKEMECTEWEREKEKEKRKIKNQKSKCGLSRYEQRIGILDDRRRTTHGMMNDEQTKKKRTYTCRHVACRLWIFHKVTCFLFFTFMLEMDTIILMINWESFMYALERTQRCTYLHLRW
jgi:hypothetical protein